MPWVKEIRIVLDSLKGKGFWDNIDKMIWDIEWWFNGSESTPSQEWNSQTQIVDKLYTIVTEFLDESWKQALIERILNPIVDEVAESIWWETL